ncbi:hypothetical protein [Rubricoccus marinus]|uniref:Uncharacterized protein n=1 Tax=Rubricoccus marinus TaxID=716817 RepID=A0A259TXZ1_9BACT|nr:hypothetical protein [Rubricoccus marinus]OZC02560.1 hypothetical protein BSZ36_05955 [Rubricoccus marinus]
MSVLRRLLTLAALITVGACASPEASGGPDDGAPFASEEDYRQRRAQAASMLDAAIQTEASNVGACRVVATSEQACGGPTSFAIYSAESSDADDVERLAERLVALDIRANAQFERVSTCMAYSPPVPRLVGGRCVE